jgi:hypothetical protein
MSRTIRRVIGWSLFTAFVAWCIWAGEWSESAKRCYAQGGTTFDWSEWTCIKIVHLPKND